MHPSTANRGRRRRREGVAKSLFAVTTAVTTAVTIGASFGATTPLAGAETTERGAALANAGGLLSSPTTPTNANTPTTTVALRTLPMIRLVAQGPMVTEDGALRLDLAVESPNASPLPPGLGVAVTLHRRTRTRSQFQSTLTGGDLGAVLGLIPPVPVNADGRTEQFVPIELRFGPSSAACPTCIRLDNDGVYPVNVELRNLATDDVVDRLTTHVIRSRPDPSPRPRLKVALVVPLHLRPADPKSPSSSVTTTRSFIERIEAMAGRPLVPLSVAPTPETIEALANTNDDPLLDQFRRSLAGREILSGPYVRWSSVALDQPRLGGELRRQTTLGTAVLRDALGAEPTSGVLIAGDSIPSAAALKRAGISVVIAQAADVSAIGTTVAPVNGPVLLDAGAATGTATAATTTVLLDRFIEGALTRPRDPLRRGGDDVLRAQHVLADLTLLASSSAAQGLAIQVPEDTPQATLDALLAGLGTTNPIIEPVTITDLVKLPFQHRGNNVVIVSPKVSGSNTVDPSLPIGDALAIVSLRARLDGYVSLFSANAPDLRDVTRRVARTLASDLTTDERRQRLTSANTEMAKLLGQVRLSRPDRLTVTARNAIVPIGVINDTGLPIRVVVVVRSSSVRLRDSGVVVDAIGTTEIRQQLDIVGRVGESDVNIETRGPGSFSMVARLTTPSSVDLAAERYRLRSTAISGFGTFLTLGSLLVLFSWWFRWGRKARRQSRQRHPAQGAPRKPGKPGKPGQETS